MELLTIGTIHSPFRESVGTPVQPSSAQPAEGKIEVFAPFTEGLRDLAGFERVWLLFWCHRARPARLSVVPYRDTVERGLFATRAPARPNPIGLSAVRLRSIVGNVLHVGELDILDGTPLLDIKPYIPLYDSFPAAARTAVISADDRFEQEPLTPAE
ncbi:MAG: tRNA (N6-threonylcarbamoyladenosine(37)-N6)-methyltransferase TrmO [Isosphaeraceae bacterium]|nr:tRNA (N6-threonylcarbamoyladenosine(37)-N6)-methyltransferase TrmO [Isosphaeraceae bacterium]